MPLYALAGKRPHIAVSAWIAPSADLIGEVVLGEEASVWFGACIRADNTRIAVGRHTNIQDGAMLHSDADAPCAVGEHCIVGHHAILHGCTIADRVLVGMGAIVLNHAVIGDECIVGAGALITERKTFAPRSLIVGRPARLVRSLDDAEVAMLRSSAQHYAEKARSYADRLTRID